MPDPRLNVTLRPLNTHEEYEACVALQKEAWGQNFLECVPPSILFVAQKVGGVTAGAFDDNGRLLGFVFGMTGVKEGRLVHWSHMLAVQKEVRGQGLGKRLKLYQRELLLKLGVEVVYWTYDPLVARNAHLNLNHLGANIQEYVPDMYGDDSGSDLHRGIGMDRFIVAWYIGEERVRQTILGHVRTDVDRFAKAPVVNTQLHEDGTYVPVEGKLPPLPSVRVEIPCDIETIQHESLELAARWRANTRRAFLWYQDKGYRVEAFYRHHENKRCFYLLMRNA